MRASTSRDRGRTLSPCSLARRLIAWAPGPNAVRFLVAKEFRQRWRGLVVLALLVGIVGATVLAAVAGARRTDSAYSRLLDSIAAADASIEVSPEYFDAIAALPQVAAVAPSSYMFVAPAEGPEDVVTIAAVDDRFGAERQPAPHPRRPPRRAEQVGEVVVNTEYADAAGVEVGDEIPLVSYTADQMTQLIEGEDPGTPAGPQIDVTVAGIARTEVELVERTPARPVHARVLRAVPRRGRALRRHPRRSS